LARTLSSSRVELPKARWPDCCLKAIEPSGDEDRTLDDAIRILASEITWRCQGARKTGHVWAR
jgi:hypothetical protein